MTHAEIVAEIVEERNRQDYKHGGKEHDRLHAANDWIAYITKHAGRGADGGPAFRLAMIRVAALAFAALEAE